MCPYPVENGLDIPRDSVKPVVEKAECLRLEGAFGFAEETGGEVFVLLGVDGAESHELGALVEGSLGRDEHGVHHVLFRSGEDEMRIRNELHVASQESFHALFREFPDLLEFIDGYCDLALAGRDVIERVLERGLCL